jgi:hypothetical protein
MSNQLEMWTWILFFGKYLDIKRKKGSQKKKDKAIPLINNKWIL